MEKENKAGYWKIHGSIVGVKTRCRKVDRHTTPTLAIIDQPDENKARALVSDWALRNMKSVQKVRACLTFWTNSGDGCETWQPFTADHNLTYDIKVTEGAI